LALDVFLKILQRLKIKAPLEIFEILGWIVTRNTG